MDGAGEQDGASDGGGPGGERIEHVRRPDRSGELDDPDGYDGPDGPDEPDAFELPAVLVQLDDDELATQRTAVHTIRTHVKDAPEGCIPTVPKLRELLGRSSIDVHEEIAYCLAELAEESAADVAPSTDAIVSFVSNRPSHPATPDLLRCLVAVADDRPDALVDHAPVIADVLDDRDEYHAWGLHALALLSKDDPEAVAPATPVLADALAADPEANGVAALSTLGRIARSEAALSTSSLSFVADAVALVDHEDGSLRNNAIGCLGDVARYHPAAVEGACPEIATALTSDDPNTRANAAIAIARVAAGAGVDATLEPARDRLLDLLDDDHAHVRLNACLAVGYGEIDAARNRLDVLATDDPDPDVRDRAAWALDRLS